MNNPIVSIVIANFNYGRFLEDAIQSVLSQDVGEKVELIICDGGSTDRSVEVIQKYAKGLPPNTDYREWSKTNLNRPRVGSTAITWWCSEPDSGQSNAFNKGFSKARGKYLTWLNADDSFVSGALSRIVEYLEGHREVEWLCCGSVFCNREMKIRWMRIGFTVLSCAHEWLPLYVIGGPSSFFLAERLKRVGGMDERLHYKMDTDLWLRFFRVGMKLQHINLYGWAFRIHEESKTSCMFANAMAEAHVQENVEWNRRVNRNSKKLLIGTCCLQIWKIISGSILRSWVDSWRARGKPIQLLKPNGQIE